MPHANTPSALTRALPALALALLALAAAGCGSDGGSAPRRVAGAPASLRIDQRNPVATLPSGDVQLGASLRDAAGVTIPGAVIAWRSLDPDAATVDAAGRATARSWGPARVVASAASFADTVVVRVIAPPPTARWRFTVSVGVRATSAVLSDAELDRLARALMDSVNVRFNVPGTFDGIFDWQLANTYRLTESIDAELAKPPTADYRVLLDPESRVASGWYGWSATALMGSNSYPPGFSLFADPIYRSIAHEFGHGRSAMDLYAQEVQVATRNTVTGTTWFAPRGMMSDMTPGWDPHSRAVINANAGAPLAAALGGDVRELPREIELRVVDSEGRPVAADVGVHVVEWYTWRVRTPEWATARTDAAGAAVLENPLTTGNLGNVLVTAQAGAARGEAWVAYTEAQLYYWRGPSRRYPLTVVVR